MKRKLMPMLMVLAALAALVGCATLNQFTADVASFGDWPAGRAPGSYAFDRLPSQLANAESQQTLEDAARPALEKAGFRPVAAGALPDVLVQIGARIGRSERSPWDDALWWHGGFGAWRLSPWRGPLWGGGWGGWGGWGGGYSRLQSQRYDREVALLIRDRASGKPLHEVRASSEGLSSKLGASLTPLFRAALAEFPTAAAKPHAVMVPMTLLP